jgi:hypothetical protein
MPVRKNSAAQPNALASMEPAGWTNSGSFNNSGQGRVQRERCPVLLKLPLTIDG